MNRIAVEVRLHLKRDHSGRLGVDGLHAYRVGDRWTPPTDNKRRKLIDELRALACAHAAAHPAALDAAAALEAEAARLEGKAAAKCEEAARRRAAAASVACRSVSRGTRPAYTVVRGGPTISRVRDRPLPFMWNPAGVRRTRW